jgi:hypothetical protein
VLFKLHLALQRNLKHLNIFAKFNNQEFIRAKLF